jgi:DNA-binding IclR family transcriptional regulator
MDVLADKKTKGVEAVDKAVQILKIFTQRDIELSLSEISRRTGLIKSTAMRLLLSLVDAGLLMATSQKTYRIGPEAYRLGNLYDATCSLESLIRPHLRELVTMSGESASFFQRAGMRRVCLFREDSREILREHIAEGDTAPLDRGAPGHVFTDFENTLPTARFRERLINPLPYVVTGERGLGITGVAAPIFTVNCALVGAITLSGPATRFDEEKLALFRRLILDAASNISHKLGSLFYE